MTAIYIPRAILPNESHSCCLMYSNHGLHILGNRGRTWPSGHTQCPSFFLHVAQMTEESDIIHHLLLGLNDCNSDNSYHFHLCLKSYEPIPGKWENWKKIVIWVRTFILLWRARKAWIQVKRYVNPHLWPVPINCGQQLGILSSRDPILANLASSKWGYVWRRTWGCLVA